MAKKSKKAPTFQYGIQITKPFSKAMYSHNEEVAKVLKFNIRDAWHNEAIHFMGENSWPRIAKGEEVYPHISKIISIQKTVMAIGYGEGYTINEVESDFYRELENMADWQLHQCYGELRHAGLVPQMDKSISYGAPMGAMMVGFDNDYYYCSIYNTYDCYEDQLTDELEKVANPNYSNPKYCKVEIPCSKDLDNEMANESENVQ